MVGNADCISMHKLVVLPVASIVEPFEGLSPLPFVSSLVLEIAHWIERWMPRAMEELLHELKLLDVGLHRAVSLTERAGGMCLVVLNVRDYRRE